MHTESRKPSHSMNLFTNSCYLISANGKAFLHPHKNEKQPTILQFFLTMGQLTIIPRARMGYESIAHEAEGRMGY